MDSTEKKNMANWAQVSNLEIGIEDVLTLLKLRGKVKENIFIKVTRVQHIVMKPAEKLRISILTATFLYLIKIQPSIKL